MSQMMALRAHARGGPEQLVFEKTSIPVPAVGEVLIAVCAAAITFAELEWDLSWTRRDGTDRTPVIPSHEVSGTVVQTGPGVTEFKVGDQVYGLIAFDRDGAAAEYVTVPAETLAFKPRFISQIQTAALPLAALTAWQALVDHAALAAGEKVLIHGGAGGVGVYAVQIAAALGARVIATDKSGHAGYIKLLGAEQVIDAGRERFEQLVSDVDVVLDTVGDETLKQSYGVLRSGGRLVALVGPTASDRSDVETTFFVVRPDADQLAHLAAMIDSGTLRSVVAQTFPLAQGRRAFEGGRSPRRPGKTVLVVR